jgi:hypothetical protein
MVSVSPSVEPPDECRGDLEGAVGRLAPVEATAQQGPSHFPLRLPDDIWFDDAI